MSKENATRLYKHFVETKQIARAEAYALKYPHVVETVKVVEEPKPKKKWGKK